MLWNLSITPGVVSFISSYHIVTAWLITPLLAKSAPSPVVFRLKTFCPTYQVNCAVSGHQLIGTIFLITAQPYTLSCTRRVVHPPCSCLPSTARRIPFLCCKTFVLLIAIVGMNFRWNWSKSLDTIEDRRYVAFGLYTKLITIINYIINW